MASKKLSIVVAMDEKGLIGRGENLPWRISEDLKLFREITTGNTVIVGRKTFESFQVMPLPNRHNIVLSRGDFTFPGVQVFGSFEDALSFAENLNGEIFVAGGKSIYEQALSHADRLYVSHVKGVYEGNVYFPDVNWSDFTEITYRRRNFDNFTFKLYERISKT